MTEHQPKGPTQNLVFAADLGGTNLRAAMIDDTGSIASRVKHPTPRSATASQIVRAIVTAASECEEAARGSGRTIRAASVVVPGTVNITGKVVVQAPNIPGLNGFGLSDILSQELGWPVLLENDANAASVGEMWRGAARGCRTVICLTLGTGVGGGIILDGQLWRGPDGSAGEIGHTTVDPFSGLRCKCGNIGCLELFASATGIVRITREELPNYPNTILDPTELNSQRIYEAGIEGDELAIAVLKKMGSYLGIGLANLVNLLNPEMIVIGGGVANGWRLFERSMHQQVNERAFPLPVRRAKIVPAECGDDAGLLGAAHLAATRIDEAKE